MNNINEPENLELLTDEQHEEIVYDYKDNVIYHAARILRQKISSVKGIIIEPLNPDDISGKTILENSPDLLLKFLQILCGEKERNLLNVLSIAQSITYVVSNGMKKMPKHVAIGVALRNSLIAKEFITILNRHGDCISYDDCLAIDTYWASEIVMNGNGYATKPTNIIPNKFNKLLPTTQIIGRRTLHNTKQIACCISTMLKAGLNITSDSGNVVKRDHNKRRSFDVPAEDRLHILSTSKPEIALCYNDITADQIICNTVVNDLEQAKSKNII